MMDRTLDATLMSPGLYAVRPAGQLGTMGWHPAPWQVFYVKASSRKQAIERATDKNAVFGPVKIR